MNQKDIMVEKIRDRLNLKEKIAKGEKILILGATGLVASRFVEMFRGDNVIVPSFGELDVTDPKKVEEKIKEYNPKFIVNFVAYTNVNEAEKQVDSKGNIDKKGDCWRVNVDGVKNILNAIDSDTRYIQISTDMCLAGGGPYKESRLAEADPSKVTIYGFTKGEAERLVKERLGDRATVVRIIYPVRAKYDEKKDYLKGPFDKYNEGNLKAMFADQQISITFVDELCEALVRIIEDDLYGTFHIASSDITTPYELTSYLLNRVKGVDSPIGKSYLSDLIKDGIVKPTRYDMRGGLDVEETQRRLGIKFSSTREIVDELVRQGFGS